MKQYEESLRREFQQRLDYLEQKASEKEEHERRLLDLQGQVTAKTLSEEVVRRQYEEQLAESADQKAAVDREVARLQHLLKLKDETETDQVRDLKLQVEHLTQDIAATDAQTHQLRETLAAQTQQVESLTDQLQHKARLETDFANLAKELTEEKLKRRREGEGDLKARLQSLEQEHQLLRRDYDTLASMHKRALKDLKRSADDSNAPVWSVEKKQLEAKCEELSEEAVVWREKTRKLVSRYFHALEKLQHDNKQLKADLARLSSETQQSVRELTQMLRRPPKPATRK